MYGIWPQLPTSYCSYSANENANANSAPNGDRVAYELDITYEDGNMRWT